MTNPLPWSSRLYLRLLTLYPEDLCRDYGAEMELVFADNLAAARRERGLRGAVHVWRQTLIEFLRLAIPGFVSNPAVRVPAIASQLTVASLIAGATPRTAPVPFLVLSAALLPTSYLPIVALFWMWACRNHSVEALHLAPMPLTASPQQTPPPR
jgi:hypothetical protein